MTVKQIGTKTIDLTKSILLELKQVTKTVLNENRITIFVKVANHHIMDEY